MVIWVYIFGIWLRYMLGHIFDDVGIPLLVIVDV